MLIVCATLELCHSYN